MRYTRTLTLLGTRIMDVEDDRPGVNNRDFSLVENITKHSISDILAFPEEGKAHFERRAAAEYSAMSKVRRDLEDLVIRQRIVRRKAAQETGRAMEIEIKREPCF